MKWQLPQCRNQTASTEDNTNSISAVVALVGVVHVVVRQEPKLNVSTGFVLVC